MSEFKCEVVKVKIEPHPNADKIEICRVGDYKSIVKKGQFKDGDLAVYIPEQAVLPLWLLKKMEFWDEFKSKGMLSGGAGNRVRAVKLRGVLSQGLILGGDCILEGETPELGVTIDASTSEAPLFGTSYFLEGMDTAEWLGIVKHEPLIPSHMRGRIIGADLNATHKYDFDNLKKMPNMFEDGEDVVITEKIHGTMIQVGVVPTSLSNEKYHESRVIVSSKGMGAKGFVLDHSDETNLYAQTAKKHGLLDEMLAVFGEYSNEVGLPVFLIGEVFGKTMSGKGVQDLTYTEETLDFRAFDICVGNRGQECYLSWNDFEHECAILNVKTVPLLYRGPYSKEVVLDHTNGWTTLPRVSSRGQLSAANIREGVVVKSANESMHLSYGRKIAKSVSEAYLLRKGTVTEFQ